MKKIKNYVALALMLVMCFCMVGCGEKDAFYGSWAYTHDTETPVMIFKSGNKVIYKGVTYEYVDNGGVLALSTKDETLNLRYVFDGDTMYVYEHMTYFYQGDGDADGLVGYWLGENGRSSYEFTDQDTFREDSYIPGHYTVNEEEHSIKCVYNDHYYDTVIYYELDGNVLKVEYPWPMVKMQ